MKLRNSLCAVTLVAALGLTTTSSPAAQQVKDLAAHFNSEPVTIIVGSAPGGGYDTFARMVARYSGKYLPGNPKFIVQNIPGGGGLRGSRATWT